MSDDSDKDVVGEDSEIFWEKTAFNTVITVRYDGTDAEVSAPQTVMYHKTGANVIVELGDIRDAEIILEGTTRIPMKRSKGKTTITLNALIGNKKESKSP